ncbi:MAG: diguanylate cyclase [Candidatus Thiodiazotropha taylori]|nr:diguanylate cyclase [Candidatus Thiodiazotropha taylori]
MEKPPTNYHNATNHGIQYEAASLRLRFLTPLVAVIVLLVMVLAVSLFYFESESRSHGLIHERLTRTQTVAKDYYEKSVLNDANALRSIMNALLRDKALSEVFASYDREALLADTEALFKELKRDYNITHFYFTKPDRVNLLRVHAPGRHGDTIDRVTTLRAEQNSTLSYGVELGPLGTFTLRVVSPWHDSRTGRLIGYLELGMEIDHVIDRLRDIFGFDVAVAIQKNYLNREKWEDGMRVLGRTVDWDRFPHVVMSSEIYGELSPVLSDHFKQATHAPGNDVIEVERDDHSYWMLSMPLVDARGRSIAEMTLLADVSYEMNVVERTAIAVGISVFILGGLLIAFFSVQATRVSQRIEQEQNLLEQLATHDSLTNLYTRRMFHEHLENELVRSTRFNHPLSLLLIDIDKFKLINDTYGHPAGDKVLQKLSERLLKDSRGTDFLCRYGGEEIAIILPETDTDDAQEIAERIKLTVSALPIQFDDMQSLSVTVSIGVATYPQHGDTDTFLISAADSALYDAKQQGRNRVCTYRSKEKNQPLSRS